MWENCTRRTHRQGNGEKQYPWADEDTVRRPDGQQSKKCIVYLLGNKPEILYNRKVFASFTVCEWNAITKIKEHKLI